MNLLKKFLLIVTTFAAITSCNILAMESNPNPPPLKYTSIEQIEQKYPSGFVVCKSVFRLLQLSISDGDIAAIDFILKQNPELVHQSLDLWGHTALHEAARKGLDQICELLLLQYGADVNVKVISPFKNDIANSYRSTPLHLAATYNHPTTCALLLRHGANFHLKDRDGKTPYDKARGDAAKLPEFVKARRSQKPV